MDHLPVLLNVKDHRIGVSGGGEAALAQLRDLLRTRAIVTVFASDPDVRIEALAADHELKLVRRPVNSGDVAGCLVFYAVNEDAAENARVAAIARAEGILVNLSDNAENSQFNASSDVDTSQFEQSACVVEQFDGQGRVHFVGAGPGDPDLLTIKAHRLLKTADVIIYDRLISQPILELAGDTAMMIDAGKEGFGPSIAQEDINALIVHHVQRGSQVVRLKSGDATIFGRLDEEIDAVDEHGLSWSIVPGITSASAAVAAIGQSLTKRQRNSSVRFLTGHDMKGFADHDWSTLARPGEVAAIYMGKKSARFIQGRLIMHGADRQTPVTVIENASRPDQRILETTLDALPAALMAADLTGPALTFYGLARRQAAAARASTPEFDAKIANTLQEAF